MTTYLLTWNPKKFYWDDYTDTQIGVEVGFETTIGWSCGVRKRLPIGSRVFMMRLGHQQPIQGIFASGHTVGEPYSGGTWNPDALADTAQFVDFQPDAMLNPDIHSLLQPASEVSNTFNWRPQASGTEIPEDVARLLETAWIRHLQEVNFVPVETNAVPDVTKSFFEGARSQITVNRYERDPKARQTCIDNYGAICCVCGFDFGLFYGEIGEQFIHVHHLNPIAAQGGAYHIDPVNDLRPVCPNCHAMLHREIPPLSIAKLKKMIRDSEYMRNAD